MIGEIAIKNQPEKKDNQQSITRLITLIRDNLTEDLLKDEYKKVSRVNKYVGHCYIASEVLYHILGGKDSGLRPIHGRLGDISHWWLEDENGRVIDLTADQFPEGFPYEQGRGSGFLTKDPSKRARILIDRVLAIAKT